MKLKSFLNCMLLLIGHFIFTMNNKSPPPDEYELIGWFPMAGHICLRLSKSLNPIFYNISSRLASFVLLEISLLLAWCTDTENSQS